MTPLYSEYLDAQRNVEDGSCDVIIKVHEDSSEVILRAHKLVLRAVSPVFKQMFNKSAQVRQEMLMFYNGGIYNVKGNRKTNRAHRFPTKMLVKYEQ